MAGRGGDQEVAATRGGGNERWREGEAVRKRVAQWEGGRERWREGGRALATVVGRRFPRVAPAMKKKKRQKDETKKKKKKRNTARCSLMRPADW